MLDNRNPALGSIKYSVGQPKMQRWATKNTALDNQKYSVGQPKIQR